MGFNAFFIFKVIKIQDNEIQSEAINKAFGGDVNKTTWKKGLDSFVTKLNEKDTTFANKKYYYVNIWTNWCIPCINEMPWLDSLAGTLSKDVGYIFVSDISDEVSRNCLKKRNYILKNFIFLNDMNDFVSGICNERGTRTKVYPMALIFDQKGEIYHYSVGAFENSKEVKELADIINKLP